MRAQEFIVEIVDADKVLQYVKRAHAPDEFNIEYSITDHPRWELKSIPLSKLKLDPEGEHQDPYRRVNWVDYDKVQNLIPKITSVLKSMPIVVDPQGWIIDGNHRATAAAEAGLKSVPAYVPADVAEALKNIPVQKQNTTKNLVETVDVESIHNDMLHKHLLLNPALYENTEDFKNIRNFLNTHITPNPIPGNKYVYASVQSTPVANYISIAHFNNIHELIKLDGTYAYFNIDGKTKRFPESGTLSGDSLSQIYFFNSLRDLEKVILLLKLKFPNHKQISKIIDHNSVAEDFAEAVNPDIVKSNFYAEKTIDIKDVGPLKLTARNISTDHPPQFRVDVTNDQGKKIGYFRFIVKDWEPEPKYQIFSRFAQRKDPYVIGGNISVWREYQRKGIARAVYQWVKSMGNDIRPSTTQTSAGQAMWRGFAADPIEENFADGKNPGRKGLSRRVGIPKKATLGQLEKIAKSSSGERRRMAQWQLNMRRGKAKKNK